MIDLIVDLIVVFAIIAVYAGTIGVLLWMAPTWLSRRRPPK